ncbi:MAG: hypothetical protein KY434_11250, partial [Actinobacteria bacterium]|nr:hypothetical protein [Actinomycetota bacterium]
RAAQDHQSGSARGAGRRRLPDKALPPDPDSGADADGDIALDVDLSLPDPERFPPPAAGYPLVVFMHGCCGDDKTKWEADSITSQGEHWHYSNAWFASRGYVVATYTSRGFVSSLADGERGSTGVTQLDDVRYEMNDFQHLAGLIADDPDLEVDPRNVVATGGSYGGGFAWLALTDPTWESPGGEAMALSAVAPRYGWTDLVYSLVPNGHHRRDALPAFDGSTSVALLGFPKRSILAGLFASGTTGVPPGAGGHATFPASVGEAFTCLNAVDPYPLNPLCAQTLATTLPEFLEFKSAYYRNGFFERLRTDPRARVPVFSAGTFTDPLFPSHEHRRMVERLKSVVPDYPVQEYYGDYQHFTQNKAKEWADVCGEERRRCIFDDYPDGDLSAPPANRVRHGVTSRLNAFVDHYARPPANVDAPAPARDVTASLQTCPSDATTRFPADEPGERFTAATFAALAPETLDLRLAGTRVVTNPAVDTHKVAADPVLNQRLNEGGACPVHTEPAGPGVAVYDSAPLPGEAIMIGRTRVTVSHTGTAGRQLNARLYDVAPDGKQVMVDRGPFVIGDARAASSTFDLHGNGWRFERGHRLRIELAQDDDPFIRAASAPGAFTLSEVRLQVPVRNNPIAAPVRPAPSPRGGGAGGAEEGAGGGVDQGTDDDAGGGADEGAREGGDSGGARGADEPPRPVEEGDLPFTGATLVGTVALGLLALAGGLALRRRPRAR